MVKMKYIIMCGGDYNQWNIPRHLSEINGEELVARTIRLLKENGIKDISISSNNPIFEKFNLPLLKHNNSYVVDENGDIVKGDWFNAFYPTDEPTCYLFGDVYFSDEAIKKIVETQTDDIEFFGSMKPFANDYIKSHEEPFALKVINTSHLKEAIKKTRMLDRKHKFNRKPIMWELWSVIKNTPLRNKDDEIIGNYIPINDITCDIDGKNDIIKLKKILGGIKMIKCEVIEGFTLGRFNELKNIERATSKEKFGELYVGDKFECDEELVEYLTGNNEKNKTVIKVIEVIPEEIKSAPDEEIKIEPKKKPRKRNKK